MSEAPQPTTAPTEPLPAAVTAPQIQTDPNILTLNPTLSASSQLLKDASRRRRTNLDGLSFESDDKLYVVSATGKTGKAELLVQLSDTLYKQHTADLDDTDTSGIQAIIAPKVPIKRIGRTTHFNYQEVKQEIEHKNAREITVDVYDSKTGELLSMDLYRGEQGFAKYLDDYNRRISPDKRITELHWGERPSDAPYDTTSDDMKKIKIPVRLGENLFDQIMQSQDEQGLTDCRGLTLKNRDGSTLQIARDTAIKKRTTKGWRKTRVWVGYVTDLEGVTTRKEFSDLGLRRHLRTFTQSWGDQLPAANIHWEVPKETSKQDTVQALGSRALSFTSTSFVMKDGTEGPETFQDESLNHLTAEQRAWAKWAQAVQAPEPGGALVTASEAAKHREHAARSDTLHLLGYEDLSRFSNEQKQALLAEKLKDSKAERYMMALHQTISEKGTTNVQALANKLRDRYLTAMTRLGLEVTIAEVSQSELLWELAKQRYYAEHPEEAKQLKNSIGDQLANPFKDAPAARLKQLEIIDFRIGRAVESSAVKLEKRPEEEIEADGQDEKGLLGKKVIRIKELCTVKKEFKDGLQEFVREDVLDILSKVEKDTNLTRTDYVALGRLSRRSVAG